MNTLQKKSLFWDVDETALEPQQHRKFIIERILSRGDAEDFLWAKDTYGEEALKEAFLSARSLDAKTLSFFQSYFNLPHDVCIQKPSLLKQAAFWKK